MIDFLSTISGNNLQHPSRSISLKFKFYITNTAVKMMNNLRLISMEIFKHDCYNQRHETGNTCLNFLNKYKTQLRFYKSYFRL